ncbi:MAG: hypothetical protein CM1200mP36_06650 [Gammaproteobacteria bacterium]|nr:MAG: hypothetical protein CM1200mP36_06650 [Gammaproteobacteria bacterium]
MGFGGDGRASDPGQLPNGGRVANRLEQINRISLDIRHGDLSGRMPQSRATTIRSPSGQSEGMLDQIQSLMEGSIGIGRYRTRSKDAADTVTGAS